MNIVEQPACKATRRIRGAMPHQGSPFMLPDYTSGVPRVHHHLFWTGFNGLPFRTPPSSEENTFFMSTHKPYFCLFTKTKSLSHLAMWPVSPRFPRLTTDSSVCLNSFISTHARRRLWTLLIFIWSQGFYTRKAVKDEHVKSWCFRSARQPKTITLFSKRGFGRACLSYSSPFFALVEMS